MENKSLQFTQEKIAIAQKLTFDMLFEIGQDSEDYIKEQWTAVLSARILYNMAEERVLIYYCPKPSFLDWLFGRTKKVEFELKVKDLMLNPSKPKDTERIYVTELKREGNGRN